MSTVTPAIASAIDRQHYTISGDAVVVWTTLQACPTCGRLHAVFFLRTIITKGAGWSVRCLDCDEETP
jgi:hypothetical protein